MRGSHTSAEDWRAAANLLGDVALANSVDEFAEIALRGMRTLFRADMVVWTIHDSLLRPIAFRMEPDLSRSLGALWAPLHEHFHEHPLASPETFAACAASEQPFLLADYVPLRRHAGSALFNEVYVHIFAKHQLGLIGRVDAKRNWTCGCNRLVDEYGPRERELARFLKFQLDRIVQALARRERAESLAGAMGAFFSQPETAWTLIESSGRLVEVSESARALLATVPGGSPTVDLLPPSCSELASAVRTLCSSDSRGPVMATVRATASLSAVVLRLAGVRSALVLFQQAAEGVAGPRLTRREAEILAWLGEGKSNSEIGVLLGVSPRTIEKHCGNLFAKIGVETRFAAALFARSSNER